MSIDSRMSSIIAGSGRIISSTTDTAATGAMNCVTVTVLRVSDRPLMIGFPVLRWLETAARANGCARSGSQRQLLEANQVRQYLGHGLEEMGRYHVAEVTGVVQRL